MTTDLTVTSFVIGCSAYMASFWIPAHLYAGIQGLNSSIAISQIWLIISSIIEDIVFSNGLCKSQCSFLKAAKSRISIFSLLLYIRNLALRSSCDICQRCRQGLPRSRRNALNRDVHFLLSPPPPSPSSVSPSFQIPLLLWSYSYSITKCYTFLSTPSNQSIQMVQQHVSYY